MSEPWPTPHAIALRAVKILGKLSKTAPLTRGSQYRLDLARDYLRLERQAYVMAAAIIQRVEYPNVDAELGDAITDNVDVPQDILFDSYPR